MAKPTCGGQLFLQHCLGALGDWEWELCKPPTNFTVGTNPRFVAIGDFNGDGKADIATANEGSNTVSVLLGTGSGSFAAATNFTVGVAPASVAIGDFNGDGKADIAVANEVHQLMSRCCWGLGVGALQPPPTSRWAQIPFPSRLGTSTAMAKPTLLRQTEALTIFRCCWGPGVGALEPSIELHGGHEPPFRRHRGLQRRWQS